MRNIFILFCFFIGFSAFNLQEELLYSVYFDLKTNTGTEQLTGFHERYFNRYTLVPKNEYDLRVAAGDELVVDATGLYIEKNKILSISREEIRENSKYNVSNGYLYGFIENDSLPVALEDESYYFLLPGKNYLFNSQSTSNVMYQGLNSREYLVFSLEENGFFSSIYIAFSPGKVELRELDFDQTQLDFRTISGKKIEDQKIPVYILNPNKDEWKKIMQQFKTYDQYTSVVKN